MTSTNSRDSMRDQVPQFEQVVRDLDSQMRQLINSTFLVPPPLQLSW